MGGGLPSLKKNCSLIGNAIAVMGVSYIGVRLYDYGMQIDLAKFSNFDWCQYLGLVIIYGCSNVLLALAWRQLLAFLGSVQEKIWALRVYSTSQLAKYLPGNICHLASRQAIGLSRGISNLTLAKSSIFELGLISFAGLLFVSFVLPVFNDSFSSSFAFLLFITLFLALVFCAGRYVNKKIADALVYYVSFLFVGGLLFYRLLVVVVDCNFTGNLSGSFLITGAYVTAWLVGLVTPGAPAGIGVREFVLLFLLRDTVNAPNLLTAVILGRVITIGGDLFFFIIMFLTTRFLAYRLKHELFEKSVQK